MALDLKLLPFKQGDEFSQIVLTTERRHELFEEISTLAEEHGRSIPEDFNTYLSQEGDVLECSYYGNTQEDDYGKPLKYLRADTLAQLTPHPAVLDNDLNRAVWAFLGALGDRWRVVLYWC